MLTRVFTSETWRLERCVNIFSPILLSIIYCHLGILCAAIENVISFLYQYVRLWNGYKIFQVRAVIGETYIYNQDEELYSKELPENIEKLLAEAQNPLVGREKLRGDKQNKEAAAKARDKQRVISYQVPHNSAVQVFDFKTKVSR